MMPLPRDGEYPYVGKPDWRLAILQRKIDEARTWAIRMKRERDELVAALKEITLINAEYDTVLNSVLQVIDAALDGVE